MNRAITLLIAILVLAGIAAAVFFVFFRNETPEPVVQQPGFTNTPNTTYSVTPVSGSQAEVQQAFQQEIAPYNDDNIRPKGASVVVGEWAMQSWAGDNQGGQGLLKYESGQKKWILVSAGGGVWTVDSLVEVGVPQNVAEDLVAGVSR